VLKDYPPHLWLPTLKLLYAGIVVQKAPAAGRRARAAATERCKARRESRTDMLEAINQGLGYATAEKG
jgi:hypothetical protein